MGSVSAGKHLCGSGHLRLQEHLLLSHKPLLLQPKLLRIPLFLGGFSFSQLRIGAPLQRAQRCTTPKQVLYVQVLTHTAHPLICVMEACIILGLSTVTPSQWWLGREGPTLAMAHCGPMAHTLSPSTAAVPLAVLMLAAWGIAAVLRCLLSPWVLFFYSSWVSACCIIHTSQVKHQNNEYKWAKKCSLAEGASLRATSHSIIMHFSTTPFVLMY